MAARSHSLVLGSLSWYGRGAMTTGILTPIWNAFFRKNMLKKHFCERTFPPRCVSTLQSLPLWEGGPAKAGSDEGRSTHPTGRGEGKRRGDRPIFLQRKGWVQDRPSHQSPSVPASPRKPSWCGALPEKRSKSGYVHGYRNSLSTGTMRHHRQTSECQRAGPKLGAGGHPPRLFASGLSLEKAWIPARDRAGNHLAGANLRWSS